MSTKLFLPMLLGALLSGTVMAQNDAPPPPPPNAPAAAPGGAQAGNPQGGRRNFDPAEFQKRMLERLKEQIGATDEEWQVISPRLQATMDKQRELRHFQAGFGGRGGRGGPGAPGAPGAQPGQGAPGGQGFMGGQQSAPEVAALQKALETKDANQIKTALAALRTARKTAEAAHQKAGDELRQVLSVNQEAQLVLMGILE